MKLLEYQSKNILASHGLRIPRGIVVSSGDNIGEKISSSSINPPYIIKAQVAVAGRGKAGGIRLAKSLEEAIDVANEMLGSTIRGVRVNKVLVEEAVEHDQEYFVSIVIDKSLRMPCILASDRGGINIEEVIRESPEHLVKQCVEPTRGLRGYEARRIGKLLGFRGKLLINFTNMLLSLYTVFREYDAELVEVNPFTIKGDEIILLDARIIIDDNSLYRHKDILDTDIGETGEYSEWEVKARKEGLFFVELEGEIGVLCNGAGLTMATMDLLYANNMMPANFLDIGGGASSGLVKKAVSFLLQYPKAKKILVNIFGGITRCDEVARGIIQALEKSPIKKPIIVRLLGTNMEDGWKILESKGIKAYKDVEEAINALRS